MINESTVEKLNEMRLKTMASAFRDQINNPSLYTLSFEERFGMIVDEQYNNRRNNMMDRLVKKATLKFSQASTDDIEYHPDRKLNKDSILQLATCSYIKDKYNIIVMGASGAGKTYISCALCIVSMQALLFSKIRSFA